MPSRCPARPLPSRRTRLAVVAFVASLAGCGGGGGSRGAVPSEQTIQSVSANGAVMPNDTNEAVTAAVTATKAAVALSGTTPATLVQVACAGGGSASYGVTGPTPALHFNRTLDAGEVYSVDFSNCRSASGAPTVSGAMTLSVVTATATSLSVNTRSTNLVVVLPQRTVTLNGNSTLTQTVASAGANTTTTNRWTSPGINVKSERPTGTSLFDLRDVDYGRTIESVNGVPVSSSSQGSTTINAQLLFFTWFITLATLGEIDYGPGGVVVNGNWRIDLSDDQITLQISPQRVTVLVDLDANGSIDLSISFAFDAFFASAG